MSLPSWAYKQTLSLALCVWNSWLCSEDWQTHTHISLILSWFASSHLFYFFHCNTFTRSLLWFIIYPLCASVDMSLHVCLNVIVSFVLMISKFLLIHLVCSFDLYSVYAWLLSFVKFTEQSLWYNWNLISSGTSPMHYSSPQWMSIFFFFFDNNVNFLFENR